MLIWDQMLIWDRMLISDSLLTKNPPIDLGEPDQGQDQCQPNANLAPCLSCVNGEIQVDDQAGGCISPDCSSLDTFRKETSQGGLAACIKTVHRPKEQLCEQGQCLSELEEACVAEEEIVATVSLPECVVMQGCMDQQGVNLTFNTGASCNNMNGTCNANGECIPNDPTAPCRQIEQSSLCSSSQVNALYCDYQIDLLLGWGLFSYQDCNDFCSSNNGQCEEAWNSRRGCQYREARTCEDNGGLAICRCSFP